ncbi:MAG: SAM-dependent methyltransferase [Candidatus Marinimicrobia bacterium]|nr:SAM-dependent methyltransferase [Candidatus Neomarinimicrobiota bacterium]
MELKPATLYVLATPIGNLEDITCRAVSVLKDTDAIICEDTRITVRLLKRYDIPRKQLITHFKHREEKAIEPVLQALGRRNISQLVSDCGHAGYSDPGYFLVSEVLKAGFDVVPIPGPSAATALLSVSHIPCRHFYFEGFLPTRKAAEHG